MADCHMHMTLCNVCSVALGSSVRCQWLRSRFSMLVFVYFCLLSGAISLRVRFLFVCEHMISICVVHLYFSNQRAIH